MANVVYVIETSGNGTSRILEIPILRPHPIKGMYVTPTKDTEFASLLYPEKYFINYEDAVIAFRERVDIAKRSLSLMLDDLDTMRKRMMEDSKSASATSPISTALQERVARVKTMIVERRRVASALISLAEQETDNKIRRLFLKDSIVSSDLAATLELTLHLLELE